MQYAEDTVREGHLVYEVAAHTEGAKMWEQDGSAVRRPVDDVHSVQGEIEEVRDAVQHSAKGGAAERIATEVQRFD
jgi:hypothetical protein